MSTMLPNGAAVGPSKENRRSSPVSGPNNPTVRDSAATAVTEVAKGAIPTVKDTPSSAHAIRRVVPVDDLSTPQQFREVALARSGTTAISKESERPKAIIRDLPIKSLGEVFDPDPDAPQTWTDPVTGTHGLIEWPPSDTPGFYSTTPIVTQTVEVSREYPEGKRLLSEDERKELGLDIMRVNSVTADSSSPTVSAEPSREPDGDGDSVLDAPSNVSPTSNGRGKHNNYPTTPPTPPTGAELSSGEEPNPLKYSPPGYIERHDRIEALRRSIAAKGVQATDEIVEINRLMDRQDISRLSFVTDLARPYYPEPDEGKERGSLPVTIAGEPTSITVPFTPEELAAIEDARMAFELLSNTGSYSISFFPERAQTERTVGLTDRAGSVRSLMLIASTAEFFLKLHERRPMYDDQSVRSLRALVELPDHFERHQTA